MKMTISEIFSNHVFHTINLEPLVTVLPPDEGDTLFYFESSDGFCYELEQDTEFEVDERGYFNDGDIQFTLLNKFELIQSLVK